MDSRSFTYRYTGIAIRLITDAEVEWGGKKEKVEVVWDTGCTGNVISKRLIEKLNLQSIGDCYLDTLSDLKVPSKKYKVNLTLPNNIELPNIEVKSGVINDCDIVIGMDIISQGDFAVSNYKGKTTFIFRLPSNGEFNYEPAKSDKVSRNDPCPCGSGKKYKHCCYKT